MVISEPLVEQSIATNGVATITPWSEAREQFELVDKYWLATVRPDSRPHVMPLFGIWFGDVFYFTSNSAARKARNISQNSHCVITAAGKTLDLVIEGEAVKVRDEDDLHHVAGLYSSKYGWHLEVNDGAYLADYGAPSAGPPPYELYEVRPVTVFGLGIEEPFGATRWTFS